MAINLKDALIRSASGIVFLSLFIGSILFSPYSFLALFTLLSAFGVREFLTIFKNKGVAVSVKFHSVAAFIIAALHSLALSSQLDHRFVYLGIAIAFIGFFKELFSPQKEHPIDALAYTALAYIYVLVPLLLFMNIGFFKYDEYSHQLILGYLLIIWMHDTGAYGFGVTFGKRRMLERISPKKSWEGEVGGIVFGVITVILWAKGHSSSLLDLHQWIILAIIIMVTGTMGDFVESLIKRNVGIKDSGNLMPGHGGILDRFDSVLLSAPFVYAYLEVFC